MIIYEYWKMDKVLIFEFIQFIKDKYEYIENMRSGIKPSDVKHMDSRFNDIPFDQIYVLLTFQMNGSEVWSDGLHSLSKGLCQKLPKQLPDERYIPKIRLRISWSSDPCKNSKLKCEVFDNKLLRKIKLQKINI